MENNGLLIKTLIDKLDNITSELAGIKTELAGIKDLSKGKNKSSERGSQIKKTPIATLTMDDVEKEEEKAAIWLFNVLRPFHSNKKVFMNSSLETWVRDVKIILGTHKRDKKEFINLVKWMVNSNHIAAVQSAGFFTKKAGKNYDIFLGFKEEEEKKVNNKINQIPEYKSKIKRNEQV